MLPSSSHHEALAGLLAGLRSILGQTQLGAGHTDPCQGRHTCTCSWTRWWDSTLWRASAAPSFPLSSVAGMGASVVPTLKLLSSTHSALRTEEQISLERSNSPRKSTASKYLPSSPGCEQALHWKLENRVKSPAGHGKCEITYSDLKSLCESRENFLKWLPQIRLFSPHTAA